MDEWQEFLLNLQAYLLVGGGAILLATVAFFAAPSVRRRPLPLPRLRPGSWGGGEVFLLFVTWFLVQNLVVFLMAVFIIAPNLDPGEKPEVVAKTIAKEVPRLLILGSPMTLVLTVAAITGTLFLISRTRPHQIGATPVRALPNIVLGVLAFLVLTPLTLGVYYLATEAFGADKHPFEDLVQQGLTTLEWDLLVFMTTVMAPVTEELLFRGVLQGWLRRASLLGHVVVMTAVLAIGAYPFVVYATAHFPDLVRAAGAEFLAETEALHAVALLGFTLVLLAGYAGCLLVLWARRPDDGAPAWPPPPQHVEPRVGDSHDEETVDERAQPDVAPERPDIGPQQAWAFGKARLAIYGGAMVFGLVHGWPQAIPLFVLALGLGWLAYRTQSLVAGMVCHALFNGVACLVLAWGG